MNSIFVPRRTIYFQYTSAPEYLLICYFFLRPERYIGILVVPGLPRRSRLSCGCRERLWGGRGWFVAQPNDHVIEHHLAFIRRLLLFRCCDRNRKYVLVVQYVGTSLKKLPSLSFNVFEKYYHLKKGREKFPLSYESNNLLFSYLNSKCKQWNCR